VVERVLGLTSQHEFTLLTQLEVDLVKIVYGHSDTSLVASAVRSLVLCVGGFLYWSSILSFSTMIRHVTSYSAGG
jgi:hypothetical protein